MERTNRGQWSASGDTCLIYASLPATSRPAMRPMANGPTEHAQSPGERFLFTRAVGTRRRCDASVSLFSPKRSEGTTLVAEAQHNTASPEAISSDSVARRHLLVGAAFLLLAGFLTLVQVFKGVFPAFLDGFGFWSYGRLSPMATAVAIFGWLTPTLIGAAYYLVPRLTGAPLRYLRLGALNLWFLVAVVIAGTFSIGIGTGDGFELFEFPIWADLLLLVALAIPAIVVAASLRLQSAAPPAALLYLVAALMWLPAIAAVSNLPGLEPVGASVLAAFTTAAVHYLWIVAAVLGLVFYLVPRLTDGVLFNEQLARIGFWTLALTGAASGYSRFTHGPGAEWLETISIVLGLLLVVVAITVFVNVAGSLRGRRDEIRASVALRFVLVGAFLIPVPILLSALAGFRSVASIVGLTSWWEGTSFFILFGIGGWVTAGFLYAVLPRLLGRDLYETGLATWHLRLSLIGVTVTSVSLWLAGLLAGFTWVGGTNTGAYVNTGEGFSQTLDAVSLVGVLTLIGVLVAFCGQLVHGYLIYRTVTSGTAAVQELLVSVGAEDE